MKKKGGAFQVSLFSRPVPLSTVAKVISPPDGFFFIPKVPGNVVATEPNRVPIQLFFAYPYSKYRRETPKIMDTIQKMAVQTTKEIVVKFIEIGRISPNNFEQFFSPIYQEVLRTMRGDQPGEPRTEVHEDKE